MSELVTPSPGSLRIAHFTNVYRPIVNGVVTSVSTFRRSLMAMGHSVYLFAPEHHGFEDDEELVFRYPALDIPAQNYPLAIPLAPHIDWLLPHLKLHAIHANHPFLLGRVAARKSEKLGIPLVFTFHTRYRDYSHYVPALPTALVEQFIDTWVGHYLSRCHVVVVPSSTIGDSLHEKYGLTDGVHVIPTGLDLSKWQKPVEGDLVQEQGWSPEDRILVSAGRLAEEKNWECLLNAFAQVLAVEPRARLIILGEGTHRKNLEALARQLGVEPRLNLPGIVTADQVLRYFKAARLFCFSSLTETQGLVTLEAMASGLPVAAVRASGTQDIVNDGENGLLTSEDPAELAQAIVSILGDDERRASMAGRAVETAGAYDANRCAARMVEIYLEAGERQRQGLHLKPVMPKATFDEPWRKFLEPWSD